MAPLAEIDANLSSRKPPASVRQEECLFASLQTQNILAIASILSKHNILPRPV